LGLLEDLTANENIELPLVLRGDDPEPARQRVADVMESLDIAHLSEKIPAETSLGEQQRICIGRALVSSPLLILADEPTGNQDHRREGLILNEFRKLASGGAAVLLATHDPRALAYCDRVIKLHDGELVDDEHLAASPWAEDDTNR
jgi:putative ABC transport system ATP-binding protein